MASLVVPKKYKLNGRWRKVLLVKNYARDTDNCGSYNPQTGDIELDASLPPAMLWETFIHELQHAMDTEFALGLEEEGVQRVGHLWAGVLQDNVRVMFANGSSPRRRPTKSEVLEG